MQIIHAASILGREGMITEAVKRFLEEELSLSCKILDEHTINFAEIRDNPELIIVMPEKCHQLSRWLPALKKLAPDCPWLVIAEYRLPGMFITSFQHHSSFLLSDHAMLEDVQAAIARLASGRSPSPFFPLLKRFAMASVSKGLTAFPTAREFEVGCAVSLGLTNTQIAKSSLFRR